MSKTICFPPNYSNMFDHIIVLSISSTALYGSATIVKTDLFEDVQNLKTE
jgi:hypothetical protein